MTIEELIVAFERIEGVTPGPWYTDSEKQEDVPYRHHAFALFDEEGRRLCGTENSDFGEIHVEIDENYYAWDEPARRLMEHIALCSPENIAMMIARIRELEENVRLFTEHAAFKVGDLVEKIDGDTKYPGEVRSVYTTRKGKLRMVIECTVPEVDGLQHIYRPDQFKLLERNRR